MNERIGQIIQHAIWRLPSWAVSLIGVVFGTLVALNIVTWDSLRLFFAQPFHNWFGEVWNYLMGGIIAAGGLMYDPRAEKVHMLTDEVKDA